MSKSKLRVRGSLKAVLWFLGLSIVFCSVMIMLRTYYPPQLGDVNLIATPSVFIGPNTLRGTVRTASDKFILILDNSQTVELDISGINSLIDHPVEVEGNVTQDAYGNYLMQVNQVKTI